MSSVEHLKTVVKGLLSGHVLIRLTATKVRGNIRGMRKGINSDMSYSKVRRFRFVILIRRHPEGISGKVSRSETPI